MILDIRGYSSIPPEAEDPPSATTLKDRVRNFFRQYGKLGVAVYASISAFTFGSIYLVLKSGIDIPGLLVRIGIPEKDWMQNAGTAAVAYAIYKLLLPIRLVFVIGLTRTIAKRLGRTSSSSRP